MQIELQINRIKKNGVIVVCLFLFFSLFFQMSFTNNILLIVKSDVEFWDKYFELIYYSLFACMFIVFYAKDILLWLTDIKKNIDKDLKYIVIIFLLTILFMVISAIILSICGIGESANQKSVDTNLRDNKVIYTYVICFLGPIVEELVFRLHLYEMIKGFYKKRGKKLISILLSSLIFALYHVDLKYVFDLSQIIAVLPIFVLGCGLAYLKEKTSNIICPILVHMAVNIIALS